jgi:hypothetical protein
MFYFYIIFNLLYNNKVCQCFATDRWFSLGTPISYTNKSDRHDKTEILLKGALNTITITPIIIKTSLTVNTIRDGPFNFQGWGGYGFFSKKNILIPNVAEKNILILMEEKNNNLIQSFCHIT